MDFPRVVVEVEPVLGGDDGGDLKRLPIRPSYCLGGGPTPFILFGDRGRQDCRARRRSGIFLRVLDLIEFPRHLFVFAKAVVVPGLLYRRLRAALLEVIESVLCAVGLRLPHTHLSRKQVTVRQPRVPASSTSTRPAAAPRPARTSRGPRSRPRAGC